MKRLKVEHDIPRLFRRTAYDICAAFFEGNRSPVFRAHWEAQYRAAQDVTKHFKFRSQGKDVQRFYADRNWPSFIPQAKEILLGMLERPDVSAVLKDEIMAAFIEQNETEGSVQMVNPLEAAVISNATH